MGLTIQTGCKTNTKNYSNFSYFLGGIDVTHQNLDQFDPFIKGVARIFLHKPPIFMEKEYKDETARFKSIIETGYTRINGISDISVDFVDFEGGFNGDKFSTVSQAKDDTDTLSITVYEQSGRPVGEYIETWVTGVRDIRSGIAHYHNAMVDYQTVRYGELYHTAEFIYDVLDPTAQYLEYSCMFAQAFPKNVPKDHLNYESGDRGNAPLDLSFQIKKYESPAINNVGQYYLEASRIEYNYLQFTPNITQSEVKARATKYATGNKNGINF